MNLIGDPKPITVNATLPKSASLDKTTLSSDGKVCWESDDKITVNGTELGISEILSDTLAVFEGSVGSIKKTDGSGYWATYPTSLNASDYTASSVDVTLPATQTYSGDNIPNYMAAYGTANGSNLSLSFKNMCCIIKIPVQAAAGITDNDAKKLSRIEIEVTNTGESRYLSGSARVSWNGGDPTLSFPSGGSYSVALDCGLTDVSTEKTFSIMLPARENYHFAVKFYDGRGLFMKKTMKLNGTTLQRNTIYTTSTVNLDITNSAFSVSAVKQVYFSSGNLQYNPSLDQWRFAPNQWDRFDNNTAEHHFDVNAYSATGTSWIDLFAWGTSNYVHGAVTYQPWVMDGLSNINYMAYGDINKDLDQGDGSADWGHGRTFNGTADWRTLKYAEWDYLLNSRTNAASLKSTGNIDGVNGAILLPDQWALPSGVSFVAGASTYSVNSYTMAQWAIMESAGAVFLPAAGSIDANTTAGIVGQVNNWGWYWSTTHDGQTANNGAIEKYYHAAGGMVIVPNMVFVAKGNDRSDGFSVRLVRDAN